MIIDTTILQPQFSASGEFYAQQLGRTFASGAAGDQYDYQLRTFAFQTVFRPRSLYCRFYTTSPSVPFPILKLLVNAGSLNYLTLGDWFVIPFSGDTFSIIFPQAWAGFNLSFDLRVSDMPAATRYYPKIITEERSISKQIYLWRGRCVTRCEGNANGIFYLAPTAGPFDQKTGRSGASPSLGDITLPNIGTWNGYINPNGIIDAREDGGLLIDISSASGFKLVSFTYRIGIVAIMAAWTNPSIGGPGTGPEREIPLMVSKIVRWRRAPITSNTVADSTLDADGATLSRDNPARYPAPVYIPVSNTPAWEIPHRGIVTELTPAARSYILITAEISNEA